MAQTIFGGTSTVHKTGKTLNLPKEPSMPKIGEVYNPQHDRSVGVKPPRILPTNTRAYQKSARVAEDPSQFGSFGVTPPSWYSKPKLKK
jgi:hypothetical protein